MMFRAIIVLFCLFYETFAAAQNHESRVLFDPTKDKATISFHSFRIPSIVRGKTSGVLIAIAEARQCGVYDYGNINVVYKRSTDNGKNWSELKEIAGIGDGTWGNPTAVVDEKGDGTIYLFVSWNNGKTAQYSGHHHPCTGAPLTPFQQGDRKVYLIKSVNDGLSWQSPIDLTSTLQPSNFKFDAMGPGNGIQLSFSPYRMIIPASSRNIYSDDHGKTWKYAMLPTGTSEGTITQLSRGALLRNDRAVKSVWETGKRRYLSRGTIEGGFSKFEAHPTLYDPRCQGSSIVYSLSNPHRLLFVNPGSTQVRCKMRMHVSYDDGRTWPISRLVHDNMTADQTCQWPRRGGYSSMAKTHDFHVALLLERNSTSGPSGRGYIELHRVNLPWIVNGATEPASPPSPFTRPAPTPSPTPNPTPNPTPKTPSPTPKTPSPTPKTPSPTPKTVSPTPKTPLPTPKTVSPSPNTPSPTPKTSSPTSKTPSPKSVSTNATPSSISDATPQSSDSPSSTSKTSSATTEPLSDSATLVVIEPSQSTFSSAQVISFSTKLTPTYTFLILFLFACAQQ